MNYQRPNGSSLTTLFPIGALIFSAGVDRLMREYRLDPHAVLPAPRPSRLDEVSDEKTV